MASGPIPPLSVSPEEINTPAVAKASSFYAIASATEDEFFFEFTDALTTAPDSLTYINNSTAVTGSAVPVTAPAPVAGAGIPGLLAGVLALLFWQGRTAIMALVRRRQRWSKPVTS